MISAMAEIALQRKDGTVRAVVLVDDEDHGWLTAGGTWYLQSSGYAARTDRKPRQMVLMHRLIVGLEHGDPRQVDHINGERLDNRRVNLRIVTRAQQQQNLRVRSATKSSQYRGVSWSQHAKKWRVTVTLDGQPRNCGYFTDEQEAADAARAIRRQHMPFSASDAAA